MSTQIINDTKEKKIGMGKIAKGDNISGYAFIGPWLIGFLAFSLIPIISSVYFSLTDYDLLSEPIFNGVKNFIKMAGDSIFWKSLSVTLFYVFMAVPLRLVFALFIAMLFNRNARFL